MLDDWPSVSLFDLEPGRTDAAGLRRRLDQPAGGGVFIAPISAAGAANMRYLPVPPTAREACRPVLAGYLRPAQFAWGSSDLVLLDRPCFLAIESGVVLLEDGRIVTETVFQWPHAGRTLAEAMGGGFNRDTLAAALARATAEQPGLWAPLLSRWSRVYGHALSEGLVQDALFAREGFSALLRYAVRVGAAGGQAVAAAEARAPVVSFAEPVIRVERLICTTGFARHCRLGTDFRLFVEQLKLGLPDRPDLAGRALGPRIYVTRQGAPARPMENEAALIDALQEMGFVAFSGAGLSLAEQAAAFGQARIVAGPFGSGLINAAFACPGAILCEMRPLNTNDETPLWDGFFRDMSAVMGFSYCAHVSENPPHTDLWTADIAEILAMIRAANPA